tara:strand:+ start:1152 stop:1316 length:165 start_codon:yes stop_codon:yes gene_type:complete
MTEQKKDSSSQEDEGSDSPYLILSELSIEKLKKGLINISFKLNNLVNPISAAGL